MSRDKKNQAYSQMQQLPETVYKRAKYSDHIRISRGFGLDVVVVFFLWRMKRMTFRGDLRYLTQTKA